MQPRTYRIIAAVDHGTVIRLSLAAVGEGRLARCRTITGDHRPMRRLIDAWREAGEPEVEIITTDEGSASRLLDGTEE